MRTPHDEVEECLKRAKKEGKRHHGLVRVEPSEEKVRAHLNRALKDFRAIEVFSKAGYSHWSPSASFYCIYHGLLAILAKHGYESRNQKCTFHAIEYLIEQKKLKFITKEDLKEISDIDEDVETSKTILDIRESAQYGAKTSYKDISELVKRTSKLLEKLRQEIER